MQTNSREEWITELARQEQVLKAELKGETRDWARGRIQRQINQVRSDRRMVLTASATFVQA